MKKVSLFFKETIARLNGDTNTVTAIRNQDRTLNYAKMQIAANEGKLIEADIEIETAKDLLEAAEFPTTEIKDVAGYAQNLLNHETKLKNSELAKEKIEAAIKYWKEKKAKWEAQIDIQE